MIKPPIKPNILISLTSLFEMKNWELHDGSVAEMSLFDKFCERLKLFDVEEQEMVIEITEQFTRIGINDYLMRIFDSFILLGDEFFETHSKIYVLPLVDPYVRSPKSSEKLHKGKTKSANFLHYLFDASDWRWFNTKLIPNISHKKLMDVFDPADSCIVLIDDFVGTGGTAEEVCQIYLQEEFKAGKLSPDKIKVVSIAAQQQGILHVQSKLGIQAVSNIIVPKGISDYYVEPELSLKKSQMVNIETTLNVSDDYKFGHGRSEAMITFLNKTPNNTFPVYWHETKIRVAPFPRYKNFNV
jgi:hypothetical protein